MAFWCILWKEQWVFTKLLTVLGSKVFYIFKRKETVFYQEFYYFSYISIPKMSEDEAVADMGEEEEEEEETQVEDNEDQPGKS